MGGQTAYGLDMAVGFPGMIQDNEFTFIESFVAASPIAPGCVVELDATGRMVQVPQGTTLGTVKGIAVAKDSRESTNVYAAGDVVAVLRRGRIYANWNGGTQVDGAKPQVKHASDNTLTNAQYRGFLSATATSATAGGEIDACPSGFGLSKPITVAGMALVDVNLP